MTLSNSINSCTSLPHENNFSGMIFIDKPVNLTSTTVVRQIKKALHISRVGHLGTLDPFATGLLPIMVGSTTRLADEFMDLDKQYLFTITLGIQTDTLDSMGIITQTANVPNISMENILEALQNFIGEIQQTPPVYSALKMNGRPLYEYMRATGKLPFDIKTKTRAINIKKCELINFEKESNKITIRVVCSKGTYVRSLARDIAQALGTVGMCSELRREKIGNWCASLALSISNEKLVCFEDFRNVCIKKLVPPTALLSKAPHFLFPECYFAKLNTGNVFIFEKNNAPSLFYKVENFLNKNPDSKFFAGIENNHPLLFLSFAECIDENIIKIHPSKKII